MSNKKVLVSLCECNGPIIRSRREGVCIFCVCCRSIVTDEVACWHRVGSLFRSTETANDWVDTRKSLLPQPWLNTHTGGVWWGQSEIDSSCPTTHSDSQEATHTWLCQTLFFFTTRDDATASTWIYIRLSIHTYRSVNKTFLFSHTTIIADTHTVVVCVCYRRYFTIYWLTMASDTFFFPKIK